MTRFSVAADEWLVLKSLTLAASSQRIERDNLKHLRPHFEKRLVTDIQAKDVSRYQHARLAEGASPKTTNLEVGNFTRHPAAPPRVGGDTVRRSDASHAR